MYILKERKEAEKLFEGCRNTMVSSCLSGIMGEILGDRQQNPETAAAVLGDFCFLAGKPVGERAEAVSRARKKNSALILVPCGNGWEQELEKQFGKRAEKITRYATEKEKDAFDRRVLSAAAESLPEGFSMGLIGEEDYRRCGQAAWSRDLTAQYPDYDSYRRTGLGVLVKKDGVPVSGASSYSSFPGGIEIEIDTREEFRRKGLAFACGARLILECLDRGLYPSWDAHNLASLNLARKLGYRLSHSYTAYLLE